MSAMKTPVFDLAIIGGGINGCGIARDAAGRGLSVFLCEQDDLASGTSSASTKLIHGGLRYLEYYEFRLVREALREREVLLHAAPHIIWPLRFILPHHKGLRPAWLIRLGLFLYDHLGGRKLLPGTTSVNLRTDEAGRVLKKTFAKGFEYSDCWVMDSRLVVLNAMDAAAKGAAIHTRTRLAVSDSDRKNLAIEYARHGRRKRISGSSKGTGQRLRSLARRAAEPYLSLGDKRAYSHGQRQSYHRQQSCLTTNGPIFSRTKTAGSSSPSPTKTNLP